MNTNLFVYGTIRSGEPNHGLLGDATFLREVSTANGYILRELDGSPALLPPDKNSSDDHGGQGVNGELYSVGLPDMAAIHRYESSKPDVYDLRPITLQDGSSAMAYIPRDASGRGRLVTSGDWGKRSLDKIAAEFAPGIPSDRRTRRVPRTEGDWELTVHKHNAQRAGSHYDLRLADPDTGHAHSWALPGADLPTSGSKDRYGHVRLAVQQPTHTMEYMDFQGKIPAGTYGAGSVKIVHRAKVPVVAARKRLQFEIPELGKFVLRHHQDKNWLLIKMLDGDREKTARNIILNSFMEKMSAFLSGNDSSLTTRLSPLRNDMSSKLKTPYAIEAPSKNVISTGKSDSGSISGDTGIGASAPSK